MAAKRELGPNPNKEGIFFTESGFLAEGITSNLFWVKDEDFIHQSLETGILNGITRQFVLTLAEQLMLQVQEWPLP